MKQPLVAASILFTCLFLMAPLPGCGGSEQSNGATANGEPKADTADYDTPVDGGWLIAHMPVEPGSLNPHTDSSLYSTQILANIIERLMEFDNETLELRPVLAESVEVSEDHLTYTYRLKEDIYFSDGEPITAEDVKFSLDIIKDPATNAPNVRNYYADILSAEIIDERTVKFTCSKPYFKHPIVIGLLDILPQHIYGEGDFNTHPANREPVGSGPYVFESWTTGQEIVLARNENYWGEKPHVMKRVYKVITNEQSALQVLKQGNMDLMNLTAEQWQNQTSGPRFEAQYDKLNYLRPGYSYIGYNLRLPMFQDKTVRQALTMLLDRQLIRDEIYYGLAEITSGPFFPKEPEYNQDVEPWPYAPEQAKAQLAAAGWEDTNVDGTLDKDGQEFRFEVVTTSDNTAGEKILTIFQESLRSAGIEMSIRQLEWATFLESVKSHDFEACMLGWGAVPYPDPYQIWHSSQAVVNGSNSVGYENPEVDQLLEEARQVFDRGERVQMYHRLHAMLHEDQPYTFLFVRDDLIALSKRFQNVTIYPYGLDAEEWWVPQALQKY